MASTTKLKRPRDEESDVDHSFSKSLRDDLRSDRNTLLKHWTRALRSWEIVVHLSNEVEVGAQRDNMERTCVDDLLFVTATDEAEKYPPELRQTALDIVRAVQRDPAVLPIELGKLYDKLHPPKTSPDLEVSATYVVSVTAQEEATVKAWTSEYVGNGVDLFHQHISHCCELTHPASSLYPNAFVVVNSSGMGKTRVIDESSKTLFTVLLVLRDAPGGFPPPDSGVLAYFQYLSNVDECEIAIVCFLKTLYDELAQLLKKRQEEVGIQTHAELANWFRGYMATWTHMHKPSPVRRAFYNRVVKKAENMLQETLAI